jgi:hypothetical protein
VILEDVVPVEVERRVDDDGTLDDREGAESRRDEAPNEGERGVAVCANEDGEFKGGEEDVAGAADLRKGFRDCKFAVARGGGLVDAGT